MGLGDLYVDVKKSRSVFKIGGGVVAERVRGTKEISCLEDVSRDRAF